MRARGETQMSINVEGMDSFNTMIYSALKSEEFSLKILSNAAEMESQGKKVSSTTYLSLIASQNIQIIKLLTYLATAFKGFQEKQETHQRAVIEKLISANTHLEKIARR
jgi:hypothetical protein